MRVKMDERQERKAFEEAAFLQYFISGIRKTDDPAANRVQVHFEPSNHLHKHEFVATENDGTYKEPTLNAAWWAWKTRAALAPHP